MIPELLSLGDALIELGFDRGWVTRGTSVVEWPEGEPPNAPTLGQVQAKFVEMGGVLLPEPMAEEAPTE